MTTLAELAPTPSTRDSNVERERWYARRADTPVFISSRQHGLPLSWLSRWLLVADYLSCTEAVIERLHRARQTNPGGVWGSIEDAFSGTPSLHATELLEPLERAVTAGPQARPLGDHARAGAAGSESNRAVAAVRDLQGWLNLTVEQVADLVGASKSAIHYWRRENAQPRPGVARNLYRVHALVRALRAATASDSPLVALNRRPDDRGPSAYDLLRAGRYEEAERLLRPLIFRRDQQPVQRPRLIEWEEESAAPPSSGLSLRMPVRRARRVTLPK